MTQGYGLADGDGFVPQLQAWLEANGEEVVILNAGVSGDTTAGGKSRVAWTLTPDVDAMIIALGGNDVLRGLPPEQARSNLEFILQTAASSEIPVLLAGINAPGNFGPDYKQAFDGIYPSLAEAYQALLYPNFLEALERGTDRATALATWMQADGVHPNAKGVAEIVADMGPLVQSLVGRAQGN